MSVQSERQIGRQFPRRELHAETCKITLIIRPSRDWSCIVAAEAGRIHLVTHRLVAEREIRHNGAECLRYSATVGVGEWFRPLIAPLDFQIP